MVDTATAKTGDWTVDLCASSPDGSLVVTIESPNLYLYYTCESIEDVQSAVDYLRQPVLEHSVRIGTFCGSLFVELDRFEKDPDYVYVSVTRPDDQAMAYALRRDEWQNLANVLQTAIENLDSAR